MRIYRTLPKLADIRLPNRDELNRVSRRFLADAREGFQILRLVGLFAFLAFTVLFFNYVFQDALPQSPFWLRQLFPLRYVLAPVAGAVAAFFAGVLFLRRLYDLENNRTAANYLWSTLFGGVMPVMKVTGGEKKLVNEEDNWLNVIGGPGIVKVTAENVAVCEMLDGMSRVLQKGRHTLDRFEYVTEVYTTEDQQGVIERRTATTRDGFDLEVRDIQYRYCLRSIKEQENYSDILEDSSGSPYEEAARSLYTNRVVSASGLGSWSGIVQGTIWGAIAGYIGSHKLDELLPMESSEARARAPIKAAIYSAETDKRLAAIGARLRWCDVGHLQLADSEIANRRREIWDFKRNWQHRLEKKRHEDMHVYQQQMWRIQAQADFLRTLINALKDINFGQQPKSRQRTVFLSAFITVLGDIYRKDR